MGRSRRIVVTRCISSSEEMKEWGKSVGSLLRPGQVLALFGDLGVGKTTFVQGLALGLGIEESIQSPTFVYLNQYVGKYPLFHFDLYRLKGAEDFLGMGFHEYFESGGISAVEWPERIESILPPDVLHICFSHHEKGRFVSFPDCLGGFSSGFDQ